MNEVAARHFANTTGDNAYKGGEDEDVLVADVEPEEEPDEEPAYYGRHLRIAPPQEYAPPSSTSTFLVSVPQNDEADARARDRIDEILRELEESMARPEPEPEHEPEPEPAPDPEPEHEPEPEPTPDPEPESEPDSEHAPRAEAKAEEASEPDHEPESESRAGTHREPLFWHKPEPEKKQHANEWLDKFTVDDDLLDGISLDEELSQVKESPDSLDSTAKLPVRNVAQASNDSGAYGYGAVSSVRKPEPIAAQQSGETNKGPEEYVASADRRERLQVNTDAAASKEVQKSATSTSTALAAKKRPLGFFASIGAFIARIFHMDD